MQVIRQIIYTGSKEQLIEQLGRSLPDGTYPNWATHITISTLDRKSLSTDIMAALDKNPGGLR